MYMLLSVNLKELRKTQYSRLQAQINQRMEAWAWNRAYSNIYWWNEINLQDAKQLKSEVAKDMSAQHKSIKEVVELQADLSEM